MMTVGPLTGISRTKSPATKHLGVILTVPTQAALLHIYRANTTKYRGLALEGRPLTIIGSRARWLIPASIAPEFFARQPFNFAIPALGIVEVYFFCHCYCGPSRNYSFQ